MQAADDSRYGGFVVSRNVMAGLPVRYSFREESAIPQFNGWTLYSAEDDDEYIGNSDNFAVLGAGSVRALAPVMLEIFDAPYGTDLCWLYEDGVHVGFYDLKADRETTIGNILGTE